MLPTPTKFSICVGSAEGKYELNAFDNALLNAGIGNLNLLRVLNILPPDVQHVEKIDAPAGSLVPTAYGYIISEEPEELIAASVGIGLSEDSFGFIMEYSGKCPAKEAEERVTGMVEEAFRVRNMRLEKIIVKAVEHRVKNCGCAFAAVVLWY